MSATRRITLLGVLVALAALGFGLFEYASDRGNEGQLHADYRTPVANPPVEPDRPDLLEEPRIDDGTNGPQCQSTDSVDC